MFIRAVYYRDKKTVHYFDKNVRRLRHPSTLSPEKGGKARIFQP
jgi:hypothetical protein